MYFSHPRHKHMEDLKIQENQEKKHLIFAAKSQYF